MTPRGAVTQDAYELALQVVDRATQAGRPLTANQSVVLAESITVAMIAGAKPESLRRVLAEDICPFLRDY